MWWLFTFTRRLAPAAACITGIILAAHAYPADAQSLETAIMPGEVIQGHAKYESECSNCHVRFERAAQTRLCLDCHKDVAKDVRGKAGYHGRIREPVCRACHTEHKGRGARIVILDERKFDHARTDFALLGKHVGVTCLSCHRARTKHRAAPSDCVGCHRKDDKHKDTLGPKCENCHDAGSWKEARFDHDKARFPLLHSHIKVRCVECHADPQHYASTPRDCYSCHRKDDKHKNTLGPKCENCHDANRWKVARYDHARSRFPLLQSHIKVKCVECHADPNHYAGTARDCYSCHRKDDFHKGRFNPRCETCHDPGKWKRSAFRHDHDTHYALRGSHRTVKCESCHRVPVAREKTPTVCYACHRNDDVHKGVLGEKCESCHAETKWTQSRFDHDRDSRFPLREKHRTAKCGGCHKDAGFREKAPSTCVACHERDDRDKGHNGQLGNQCERCHAERSWRETTFDHKQSRFLLLGRHVDVECRKCHASIAFKDAKSACVSCHTKDDYHKARLGPRCEQCHDARDWKAWKFDHDRNSRFKLTGAHVRVACLVCHAKPVADKLELATDCASCHLKSDDVHLGSYGTQCERCHVPDNWRKIIKPAQPQAKSSGRLQ